MEKPKYEKPAMRNLDAVQPVQGSCWSGEVEYVMNGPCTNGDSALENCGTGTVVFPFVYCGSGSDAGQSCRNGSTAG